MSDIVEHLREEGNSDCVAFTEFMLQYKKNSDTLYCFFEGYEDRTYYTIRIENISGIKDYSDFVCIGKDNVLKVHKLIKENIYYKNAKTCYFIDSDYDPKPEIPEIYVTPTYSIENLYCCKESFEKILITEFKIKKTDKDFDKCVNNYLDLQNRFNSELLNFNAWLACQADQRNKNKTNTRLNIDKTVKSFFEKIILPDLNSIKSFSELSTKNQFELLFPNAPIIEEMDFQNKVKAFENKNHTDFFRGKFLLRFLENYLCRLQSISGSCSFFENKYSCSLRLELATICSNLSQYAKTPDCLRQYILSLN